MNNNYMEEEILFQITICFIENAYQKGFITKEELKKYIDFYSKKYNPVLSSFLKENAFLKGENL